ncbi:MAG: NAD-dependent epimerase/dehydratase family protein [Thermoplasmata archaeon]|uniref:NAD-dependent epimerase/dehydratase family protein n=1 Tax=Candidatus Sysuiplasma superficiale TaxID=2823368 RepID=A0A8J7YSX8_9ARCH|nr:NAD-dependent epimerase/dehydratase family protein [Candidatus Sysuiplasma superficiale]
MNERIFVTGACGFIGRHLVYEAVKEGYDVSGLAHCDRVVPDARITVGDIRDAETVEKASAGCDYFIHLAAVTSNVEFERRTDYSFDVNIGGFRTAINAALKNRCRRFIFASSAAIYLDSFSEKSIIPFDAQRNHYAKTKMVNEMVGRSYGDVFGMKVLGLRFFNVYGPGENEKGNYASIMSQFIRCSREGRKLVIYGDGSQERDFVHVRDVARITLKLSSSEHTGVVNVGTGRTISYRKIADIIDRDNQEFVPNPLSSYQMLTRADTALLKSIIGGYEFIRVEDGIRMLMDGGVQG